MRPSVTLLGTGGPRPDVSRGATALLIQANEDAILIDAGRGVVRQLAGQDVPLARIDPVLITHHHYDHIGELHDVILSSWLTGRAHTLRLFGPPETRRIVEALLHQVYDKDIEFRVREAGNGSWQPVEVTDILAGTVCEGRGWRITAEVVGHGNRLDLPLARSEIATPDARRLADYTLASADTVGRIAAEAKVGTVVLTHHRQKPDQLLEQMRQDVARDFTGKVLVGFDGLRVSL